MNYSDTLTRRRRLVYLRDLLVTLVGRDMKLRYKRSVLGVAWSLLNPLAQLLVFSFIFQIVLPLDIPNFSSFLFIGLLAWNWFQSSLIVATTSIVDNRELARRSGFPVAILPVITIVTHFIHFLLALPVLLVFLWLNGISLSGVVWVLPSVFVLQFVFTLGLAYLAATFHVAFRDTQYLLGILLFLGFYLSPVFYDSQVIPARYQFWYQLNPLAAMIDAYRAVLMHGQYPNFLHLLLFSLASFVLLLIGYLVFRRASARFVEEL